MRNLTTRRLLAKLDREEDVYVILDRVRQVLNDQDGEIDHLEQRLNAIEQEKVKFQTESGVHRIIESTVAKEAIDWGKWAIRGTLATAAAALAGWILKLAWKGLMT